MRLWMVFTQYVPSLNIALQMHFRCSSWARPPVHHSSLALLGGRVQPRALSCSSTDDGASSLAADYCRPPSGGGIGLAEIASALILAWRPAACQPGNLHAIFALRRPFFQRSELTSDFSRRSFCDAAPRPGQHWHWRSPPQFPSAMVLSRC